MKKIVALLLFFGLLLVFSRENALAVGCDPECGPGQICVNFGGNYRCVTSPISITPQSTHTPTPGVSGTPTLTPTPNPNCLCITANAANVCTPNLCQFDKYENAGITYASPQGCGVSGIFQTAPSAAQKNSWCQRNLITKGDATGDGEANFVDYFYYIAARFGGKVPPDINPDFNGNNMIDDNDKKIIIKSLKQ